MPKCTNLLRFFSDLWISNKSVNNFSENQSIFQNILMEKKNKGRSMQVFDGKKQTPTNSKDHQVFLIMNVSQDSQEFQNF